MAEEERDFIDNPEARDDENLRWLGVTADTFRGWPAQAIRHASEQADADPGATRWKSLGPRNVGGAVRSLAQDPVVRTTFYGGSAQGGLWKSTDDGATWKPIGEPELVHAIGALAVAPSSRRTVYAGTGEPYYGGMAGDGFFKSVNGGDTWERLVGSDDSDAGGADNYGRIVVDPRHPNRAWMASSSGLWRLEGSSFHEERLPGEASKVAVTDVALVEDPADPSGKVILLAGVPSGKIYRGVHTRSNHTTNWGAGTVYTQANARRVRLAFSGLHAASGRYWAYAVMEDRTNFAGVPNKQPTIVFQSKDNGATWPARPGALRPGNNPVTSNRGQAWYDLDIAVDPLRPQRVVVGQVDLYISNDEAMSFAKRLDWRQYGRGDRAQHADQHAIIFDKRNTTGVARRKIWVGNDGGISMTEDTGVTWRKRSYGITAAQLVDVTTHPVFPFIYGGGMQDNGTFVSFGGPSWYRLWGGDGGQMAFDPTDPRRFYVTSQTNPRLIVLRNPPSTIAHLNFATLPDLPAPNNEIIPDPVSAPPRFAFPAVNNPPFVGVLEGHPTTADRLLVGRLRTGFSTRDGGQNVNALNGINIAGQEVSGVIFAAPASNELWAGMGNGKVFKLAATAIGDPAWPGAAAWTDVSPPGNTLRISGMRVHPSDPAIVAVSTMGNNGRVYLTYNGGTNWREISGPSNNSHSLPRSPIPCLAFAPQVNPADPPVLFAGTLAGVYVIRNLPAKAGANPVPAFSPHWKTYNNGLPLTQVNDLEVSAVTRTLRCATHGRGVFECNITGTAAAYTMPPVRLMIRQKVTDDGWSYPPGNTINTDPRLPAGIAPAFTTRDAFDIRVDAPHFEPYGPLKFGGTLDGSEFDETMAGEQPLLGDTNYAYVQVHNRGREPATNVKVHLYFANANDPVAVPPLHAGMNHPHEPTDTCPWQLAGPVQEIGTLEAGEPYVARFEWVPPLRINKNVVLLGVVTNSQDPLANPLAAGGNTEHYARDNRQAALRVLGVRSEVVYLRDGIDDQGALGSVAWGGRSPDIIVGQAPVVANPDGTFTDLAAQHSDNRVKAGTNHLYVRVFNRAAIPIDADVEVYAAAANAPFSPSDWSQAGATASVTGIPARGWKFATINWPGVAAPATDQAFTLVAMVRGKDPATGRIIDPYPYPSAVGDLNVSDVGSFWTFSINAPLANNAAVRSVRFAP